MSPPAVEPVGQLIPLACAAPLYVLSAGELGHVKLFLFTVAAYVAEAPVYCPVAAIFTVIVAVFPSVVLAFGVIVNVFPLTLHVATVLSLDEHVTVPFPVFVIVLVAFVPYVNVPLVGFNDMLPVFSVTVAAYVLLLALL